MKILKIVLLIVVLIVLVLAIGGAVIYNRWTHGPLPQTDGTVTLAAQTVETATGSVSISGLDGKIEIIRDTWGIPHVYASTTHDLMFGQGYVQAQDRWWQMEFARAIGDGRIQELTGQNDSIMGQDVFIRTVGWREAAERDYATYGDEMKSVLQAFADGVNAYILSRPASELAFEYNLLGVTGVKIPIRAWVSADTLVWAKVMAWDLSGNRSAELTRAALYEKLGESMTDEFIPGWPFGSKPTILKAEDLPISDTTAARPTSENASAAVGSISPLAGSIAINDPFFREEPSIGSNNWTISGDLTASGKPLLANDPHLSIQMPSIWYEIGLHCETVGPDCPYDVRGFALPASPGIIIGHNAHIAWGVTNVGPDTQDLYKLEINPDNELQYKWNGEWRDITVREETIHFGDSTDTVTIKVRETHLGPIINDNSLDENGKPTGFNNVDPLAFHWTALIEPSPLFKAVLGLNRASNWDEFRAAASYWDVPAQNLVYADIEGNIGYQTPGNVPIRAAGHSGLVPIDGTTDQYEWKGYIPFDDLPRAYNPERGYIATANQAVVPLEYYDQLSAKLGAQFGADSNYFIGQEWAYGYRGQRIEELLTSTGPHTIDTIKAIQGDNKMISAEELAPYLQALDMGDAAATETRDWMLNWDYQMNMDSQQAGLYGYFWRQLLIETFDDQLGGITSAESGDQSMWAIHELAAKPDDAWWDNANTSDKTETRDDIFIRAFRTALDRITKERGTDRAKWAWGQIHTATFVSNPLGASGIDPIESLVNRGAYETGGGADIVNATGWNAGSGKFDVVSLPSMRMIVDLNDLSQSVTIHTTGESGHPFSPHYGDMIDAWRKIEYHPMLWTREQVEKAEASRLILQPGS